MNSRAQFNQYPFEISGYNFIQYDSNKIKLYGENENFIHFFSKLDTVLNFGIGQVNIVYIGGSHIQADIMTGQMRNRFQSLNGGQNAGRGLVFPLRLAHTNTPYGYFFDYTGNWETCRNVEKNKVCDIGMAGIMAVTKDSLSSLTLCFEPENPIKYDFNAIRIYHRFDSLSFDIILDSALVKSVVNNPDEDYTEFKLNNFIDSIDIRFVQTDSLQTAFELYGILPISSDPGIIFHSIGINGAATSSFLNCNRMEPELKSIKPDLVIFGLGINDAYGRRFNQEGYEQNYDSLTAIVCRSNPDAAIIYATNNDSYLYKRYVNRNGLLVQESMKHLALRNDAAVWDMFEIMGGLNSIQLWKKSGLAKYDRIHFTREGYIILGDLFFDSIMQDFGYYLQTGKTFKGEITEDLTKF